MDYALNFHSVIAFMRRYGAGLFADVIQANDDLAGMMNRYTLILALNDSAMSNLRAVHDEQEILTIVRNHVSILPVNKDRYPAFTSIDGFQYGNNIQELHNFGVSTASKVGSGVIMIVKRSMAVRATGVESTLDILNRLFKEDPRLAKTKPARKYGVDPEKWKRWQSLATPELKSMVKYVEYHFDQWLASLATGIDGLLAEMDKRSCDIYVSTGASQTTEQSASELWMFYIFERVMEAMGKRIEPFNEFWSILRKGSGNASCLNLLIIDDLVRTGTHLTMRMAKTPDLFKFMSENGAVLFVLAPIMVLPEIFHEMFGNIIQDAASDMDPGILQNLVKTKTIYLTGIYYDLNKYPYLVIDHNGSDKYDSEIAGGNIGNGRSIGPLLEGDSVNNSYRYPPPLYHLEFGSGTLPRKAFHFIQSPDDDEFYSISFR